MLPGDEALVVRSLERAAELCDDLTPLVYARLFAAHPEMEALFIRDTNGQVRGEMLTRAFEAILDFVGDRRWAHNLIQTEVVNHEGWDVPRDVFAVFFGTVAETIKAEIGAAWTTDTEAAWSRLLGDLDWYVKHPDQAAAMASRA